MRSVLIRLDLARIGEILPPKAGGVAFTPKKRGGYRHGKSRSNLLAMADNDKLSRGTLIGFIGGLIGVALTASSGNEQLIAGAFVVGCILGVVLGTVKSDWK